MKRLGLLIATLVVLVACQAAQAHRAHAEGVTRTLFVSGPVNRAADWSPEGKPAFGDTLIVPAGKHAEVLSLLKAGSIIEEPGASITGSSPIETNGSLTLNGSYTASSVIYSYGLNRLTSGGNRIEQIEQPEGIIQLQDPLHVGTFRWHGTMTTESHNLHVDGQLYRLEGSYTNYGTSTVTVGEYQAYPLKVTPESKDTLVEAMHATLIVSGMVNGLWKGAGGCYGSLLLEAGEALISRSSYQIEGRWEDNTPTLEVERDQTITIEGDELPGEVIFGARAQVVKSTEPGRFYTLNLPYPMEATTTATISDMHVTGAPLTLHGAHEGTDDEGVVFAP